MVAKWEGALDEARLHRHLSQQPERFAPDEVADDAEAVLVQTDLLEHPAQPVRM